MGASNYTATYNALNQISTTAPGASRTNEWDAEDRLVAVNTGNQRTEFTYDGMDRMVSIRQLTNGAEASFRRFVWCDNMLCEERDGAGVLTKRFFDQGMKVETGPVTGAFFYTRDHLGSIREMTDGSGTVRARYAYDPYGRGARLSGDMAADFGFAGMFFAAEAGLSVARFRAFDPTLGRWLSRDPLRNAEITEGANLYAYVRNNSINAVDPLGLCCENEKEAMEHYLNLCKRSRALASCRCARKQRIAPDEANKFCASSFEQAEKHCNQAKKDYERAANAYYECMQKPCDPCAPPPPKPPLPKLRLPEHERKECDPDPVTPREGRDS